MRESVTVSLSTRLKKRLDETVKKEHVNRSDVVREALRQYFAQQDLKRIRKSMIPLAEEKGIFTDEDVFKEVS